MSPMERTLAVIKKHGLKWWKVEYWQQWAKRRIDLFNIIDLLVLDNGIVGVQVCGSDFAAHRDKLLKDEAENTRAWLENDGRIELWGWRKLKKVRGKKATHWKPRIADIVLSNGELYFEERGKQ